MLGIAYGASVSAGAWAWKTYAEPFLNERLGDAGAQ